MEIFNRTLTMILLGICTYFDIREKKIPMLPVCLSAVLSVGFSVHRNSFDIASLLMGLLMGVLLCGFSLLSKGGIGLGDGLLAGACGVCIGFYETLGLFFGGFFLAGITGFLLVLVGKKSMKEELPLVPFLYVAYSILCVLKL